MQIEDFIGQQGMLTGVDYGTRGEAAVLIFTFNGVTYVAQEDPEDGYRSSMEEIKVSKRPPKNVFEGTMVMIEKQMEEDANADRPSDIMIFKSISTGKVILEIGTNYHDEWYPSFVACFTPENLDVNQPPELH